MYATQFLRNWGAAKSRSVPLALPTMDLLLQLFQDIGAGILGQFSFYPPTPSPLLPPHPLCAAPLLVVALPPHVPQKDLPTCLIFQRKVITHSA